jgi:hypothetical protein
MDERSTHIILTLDTERPIEVGDFVSAFESISSQYQKFVRTNYPDVGRDVDIYVKEITPGSIIADLIAWGQSTLAPVGDELQKAITESFVRYMDARLSAYFKIGGRDPKATKSDLSDFMGAVQAIANDTNGSSKNRGGRLQG